MLFDLNGFPLLYRVLSNTYWKWVAGFFSAKQRVGFCQVRKFKKCIACYLSRCQLNNGFQSNFKTSIDVSSDIILKDPGNFGSLALLSILRFWGFTRQTKPTESKFCLCPFLSLLTFHNISSLLLTLLLLKLTPYLPVNFLANFILFSTHFSIYVIYGWGMIICVHV